MRRTIQKEELAKDGPHMLVKDLRSGVNMRWCMKDEEKLEDLRVRFQDSLKIIGSNYNEYLSELKEEALYRISQVFKHVMYRKIEHLWKPAQKKFRYHMNVILPKQVLNLGGKNLEEIVHQYPLTQVYDPNISPFHSNVVRVNGLSVLYLNIDGKTSCINSNHQ